MLFNFLQHKTWRVWGKARRVMPPHATVMKEKILSQLPVAPVSMPRTRSYSWAWSLSGAVVLLVIVAGQQYLYRSSVAEPGASVSAPTAFFSVSSDSQLEKTETAPAPQMLSVASDVQYDLSAQENTRGLANSAGYVQDKQVVPLLANDAHPVPDTREFIKYNYYASIKTRKVQEVAARLQTIIRGYEGRVDSVLVHEKFGSINFVIPKSSFEAFTNEVKSLVPVKLYTERVSGQNLLPEKLGIENSAAVAGESLSALQAQLSEVNKNHAVVMANLQKQLSGIGQNIASLLRETTTSTVRQEQVQNELSRLYIAQARVQKQIAQENQNYNSQKFLLNDQIKSVQENISGLQKQNQDLLQNVETVEGRIEVEWASVVEIIKIYCPYYWVWVLLCCAVVLLVRYGSKRRTIEVSHD